MKKVKDISVIIPAAGTSRRMKSGRLKTGLNKPYLIWQGKPLLLHIIEKFAALPSVAEIIVAINPADRKRINLIIQRSQRPEKMKTVQGGRTRQDSVFNALKIISPTGKIILVHDAARPLIRISEISRVIRAVRETGAAILASPVVDTIKKVNSVSRLIRETVLPRRELWLAQTPQGFKNEILLKACRYARKYRLTATDEACLAEKAGYPVKIIKSRYPNPKITTPDDWQTLNNYKV